MAADEASVAFSCSVLEGRGFGAYRLLGDRPDEGIRDRKAVDFLAEGDDGDVLAIEHTAIEPYEGFLADLKLAHERLGTVRERLAGRLPADSVFDIQFRPGSANAIRRTHEAAITEWVAATAPQLRFDAPHHYAQSPEGLSGPILTLYRWPLDQAAPGSPRLRYRIGVNLDDLEGTAVVRCRRALRDKLPKLERARDEHAARRTMLVLESADIQMTNPWSLGETIRIACVELGLAVPDFMISATLVVDDKPVFGHVYCEGGTWLLVPAMVVA